jgi:uncharacterized membrane protein YfcA
MLIVLIAYLVLGAAAGLLAGLFGIGGGLIIVPVLVFGFELQGVNSEVATHLAVGTSLATIIFTSVSSVKSHHDKQAVVWSLFKPMALGLTVGAVLGAMTAAQMQGAWLRFLIGIFAIVIGLQMALALKPKPGRDVPGRVGLVGIGAGIGWASAIFGIGGGSLSVPFLTWCNVRMQQAVGTSAAGGLPIALMGTGTNIHEGWGDPLLPDWSLGFIYVPAVIGIVLASVPFARVGARLAHNLQADVLKRYFSLLLFLVGSRFLYQSWGQIF